MLLNQFLNYRRETESTLDFLGLCREKYTEAMIAYAMKVPVMSAMYSMWEETPFKKFDCLTTLTRNYQHARGLLCT